ncbi:hypothetical protein QYM36_001787 [Artemia franciscana]|uniref:ISXO2-like transposase domain-containing protein n=1 Tax=Artemia franciscana TaxID=6661 RepID=A0AA88IF95_ARTSF|nr:hypothetical protein QYM36_001787 [Artemia franciscana]
MRTHTGIDPCAIIISTLFLMGGRPLSQVWVFGRIEMVSKRKFIIPVLDGGETLRRDKETLITLIQRYIRPGSIIVSIYWAAYSSLSDLGFTHHQINHFNNFVDPDVTIPTQFIEKLWWSLKKNCKRLGMRSMYLKQYIAKFLFLETYEPEEHLHYFLTEAKKPYPLGSEPSPSRVVEAEAKQGAYSDDILIFD